MGEKKLKKEVHGKKTSQKKYTRFSHSLLPNTCNSVTLNGQAFNKTNISAFHTILSYFELCSSRHKRLTDPQELKGIPNCGYPTYIMAEKQRSIKTKENRTQHPLQPDYAKFNQYKGFCTAVGYKPLMWPHWKFLFASNTLKICSSFQRRICIFQGFSFL